MLIPIPHDDFQQKTLSLKPTGFLKGPGLVLGDEPVHGSKLKYQVMDDIGRLRNVELKPGGFDTVPKVFIDGQQILVVEPFKWFEYIWMGLPILLVVAGGALGGACGGAAFYLNMHIFRGDHPTGLKYFLGALAAVGATVTYLVVASIIGMLFA